MAPAGYYLQFSRCRVCDAGSWREDLDAAFKSRGFPPAFAGIPKRPESPNYKLPYSEFEFLEKSSNINLGPVYVGPLKERFLELYPESLATCYICAGGSGAAEGVILDAMLQGIALDSSSHSWAGTGKVLIIHSPGDRQRHDCRTIPCRRITYLKLPADLIK